jgi:hypothetical protein
MTFNVVQIIEKYWYKVLLSLSLQLFYQGVACETGKLNIFVFQYKILFCVGLNKNFILRFTKLNLNGYLQ